MSPLPDSPEVRISNLNDPDLLKYPIISNKKVKKIPMGQINFNDSYNKTSNLNESAFSVT